MATNTAPKDGYGYPALFGIDQQNNVIPVKVLSDGSIQVSGTVGGGSKRLKKVLHFDFATARTKQVFEESFSELTVLTLPKAFDLYLDQASEDKRIPITQQLNIQGVADRFYITNTAGTGELVLCLWE